MMKDMTDGTPWKMILRFSFPIMTGELLQQLYHTADTLIVGNVEGELALSAVGACASLTEFFTALAIGFSTGAGVLIAQYYGAGRRETLRNYAFTAILLLFGMGIAVSALGMLTGSFLLRNLLHVPENMRELSAKYFCIYSVGLIFQFGYNVFAALLRAVGDSKATLYFLLISSSANILLDFLLVKGLGLGVGGAAAATVVSQLCACAAGGIYMYTKYELLRFRRCQVHFALNISGNILKVGMPMALQYSLVSLGLLLLQRLVNFYGQSMIASFTVVSRLQSWITIPIKGLQSTMATYAGQNMGAGKKQRISLGLGQSIAMSMGITLGLSAVIYGLMEKLVKCFGIDGDAMRICVQHLRVMIPSVMMYAAYFPMNGVFQGVGDGVHATAFAILALALRILFSYTLSTLEFWGYTAIWWSETFAWVIVLTVYYIYYFGGNWKNKMLLF